MDCVKIRDFAERYTAAWCSQDPASVAAFFAPQGSLTVNDGDPAAGRTAIAEVARSFMTDFPDLRVIMDDVVVQDDRTDYHWTLIGTHAGSGNKVRISGFERWQIGEDGLIAASQGQFDSADYEKQVKARSH